MPGIVSSVFSFTDRTLGKVTLFSLVSQCPRFLLAARHVHSHANTSRSQSRSDAYLSCVLPRGFSRKRETARSPGEKMMSTTNVRSPCLLLISKIMERAVQVQLVSFLTENNREARAFLRRGRQPEENISRGPGPYCVPDFYTTYL